MAAHREERGPVGRRQSELGGAAVSLGSRIPVTTVGANERLFFSVAIKAFFGPTSGSRIWENS